METTPTTPPDFTWSVIKLVVITIIFIILLVLLFTIGSLKEIAANFPRYRCNPLIMPFASNFGYDAVENFNYCLNTIFLTKASEIFQPIYNLLGGFTQVITLIVNVTLGIRQLFSNFLMGVNGFVRSVRDKIQSVLFSIRMNFIKLNNLMGRVYGTMYAVIFMGMSAMTAGFNIADNDLVKFLFEFCFDPNTPIVKYSGETVAIKDIQVGDRLLDVANKPVYCTSTFVFNGLQTPMVKLGNTVVSGQHYVLFEQEMIPAEEHPDAIPVQSIPQLVCLNVSGHKMKIEDYVFADYDEHSDENVVKEAKQIAHNALNGGLNIPSDLSGTSYDLGIEPTAFIKLKDNSYKLVKNVKLGDELAYSGKVFGIVNELCDNTCNTNGIIVSTDTLVWFDKEWKRTFSKIKKPIVLTQFITERTGVLEIHKENHTIFVRDYREVPFPEMEQPYTTQYQS